MTYIYNGNNIYKKLQLLNLNKRVKLIYLQKQSQKRKEQNKSQTSMSKIYV
jgi:hypothetical protein